MLCLKVRTEHLLELSGILNLVTTGENFRKNVGCNDRSKAKQTSQPLKGLAGFIHKS